MISSLYTADDERTARSTTSRLADDANALVLLRTSTLS